MKHRGLYAYSRIKSHLGVWWVKQFVWVGESTEDGGYHLYMRFPDPNQSDMPDREFFSVEDCTLAEAPTPEGAPGQSSESTKIPPQTA